MSEPYIPVPVVAASRIADEFRKDIVIILAIDLMHQKSHFTTFGRTPSGKRVAAGLAEQFAVFTGHDMNRLSKFEDFRAVDQSEWAAVRDRLTRERNDLLAALKMVLDRWTFDNYQQHTHSWHDRADCFDVIRAAIAKAEPESRKDSSQ